ncbi:NADH:flavin oxidoreductase/NADH oxidase [Frateuria aurantia]
MSRLFSPFQLGQLSLRNRIVVEPMAQYSAQGGCPTDWHLIHLGQLALSGAAMLFTEAVAVSPEGRISPYDLGLWSDATEAAMATLLARLRPLSQIRLAVQLGHAGRKNALQPPWQGGHQLSIESGGWQGFAPSALAASATDAPPKALDENGLALIRQQFVEAAVRAHRIGFQAIELHAAHGYLLHQFLTPLANQRSDRYGGSLENRLRFPLEVFEAVRAALPSDLPVGVRVSASDWVDGGWDLEQTMTFARALEQRGCGFIDVSSGGASPQQKITPGPGYQLGFAARIKAAVNMPVIGVGQITEAIQAETALATEQADLLGLARAMLYNPRWPWHAAAELGAQVEAPRQYLRCQPHGLRDLFLPPP